MVTFSIKILWIVVAILFAIAEAATITLTLIWFSLGAIFALITSFFTENIFIQISVFIVVSGVSLGIATKYLIKSRKNKKSKFWSNVETNYEALIGDKGFVLEDITPKNSGLVKVRGQEWTAISKEQFETIKKDEIVEIKEIRGVKLVVSKFNK